jgi:hypothetical protein
MSGSNGRSKYADRRYELADESGRKWKSRYDIDTAEGQNLNAQGIDEIYFETVDLSVARAPQNPYRLGSGGVGGVGNSGGIMGRSFSVQGISTSTLYNYSTNAGIDTVATNALILAWIGRPGGISNFFSLKNGDGYRGDFADLYFFWPAQSGLSMKITVYRFDDMPFMSGDFST